MKFTTAAPYGCAAQEHEEPVSVHETQPVLRSTANFRLGRPFSYCGVPLVIERKAAAAPAPGTCFADTHQVSYLNHRL